VLTCQQPRKRWISTI